MSEKIKRDTQSVTNSLSEDELDENPYLYKESGIMERQGKIPLWLKGVAIGLIIWSIYYTIKYWSAG